MIALTIVIPAFNEEQRLGATLARVQAYVADHAELAGRTEILVVDDGSRDGSAALAREAGVEVLSLPVNRGKGAAVRAGVLAAAGARILVCDADLATPIEAFPLLAAAVDAGADIAVGSRRVAATITVDQPWPRRWFGRGFRVLVRYGLGIEVRDTMCGFKLFTRGAARDLFGRARIERFAFDVEIFYLARGRYRVAEVPVTWRHVEGSRVALGRDVMRAARDLVAIRLRRDESSSR